MRGLIGDLCIKTCLVNQNPAETCQVFGKNFSGQLYAIGNIYQKCDKYLVNLPPQ